MVYIADIAAENLYKRGDALGNSFDDAYDGGRGSKHGCQKDRNKGINHFGAHINKQADKPKQYYIG